MDNKKMGEFISTLRKSRNLTQRDLANQLGITDKAVSKWERGAGYPDISMLRPIADILGTTVNELLEGEVYQNITEQEKKDMIKVLDYVDKVKTGTKKNLREILVLILLSSLLLAISTCTIVNVAVNQSLTWSILVIIGCVMGGFLLLPLLLLKRRGWLLSLCFLTILILPFLYITEMVTSIWFETYGWFVKIGLPVSITWSIILWFMVLLCIKVKINFWFHISIGAIICIPGNIITNYVVDQFVAVLNQPTQSTVSTASSVIILITLAGFFFFMGLLRNNKDRYNAV
jgi:transcriptional regulator with XRE-family HTH domain